MQLPYTDAKHNKEDSYKIFFMESSQAEMSSSQNSVGCNITE